MTIKKEKKAENLNILEKLRRNQILPLVLGICFVVFLVVDLIENLDRFIDNSVPWNIVFKYYRYYKFMIL